MVRRRRSIFTRINDSYLLDSSTGKQVLQDLIKTAKERYPNMPKEEINKIVTEYEEAKTTKAKGRHTSAKSMLNDVVSTMSAVENEVIQSFCNVACY